MPADRSALKGLAALYRSRNDWRNVARVEFELHKLDPKDTTVAGSLVEALLRAGNVADARRVSGPLLSAAADPKIVDATLASWVKYAPAGQLLPDAWQLANAATDERRVAFANYFNGIGKPAIAASAAWRSAPSGEPANARANAIIAQSLALQGRYAEAKQLFDRVLEVEPDQLDALRGRSALEARTGMTRQAIVDAQRLVTRDTQHRR